ncbi:TIGR03862 family flavoprotein [Roseovarius sp. CAU 1744]|uniref:TIGR03862 family flavoprotein n=1 Tax=Roseovarius sp. CAU 1744 TaxID=3140368 RepID=UPI00325B776A
MMDALVIGAGPAGLMAAEELARAGHRVRVAEAKPSVARKLLMAGKSGLNLTRDEPFDRFLAAYGRDATVLDPMLRAFGPEQVKNWATGLEQSLFTGSTGRVFPTVMKASPLLRAWLARLSDLGVEIRTRWHWQGWDADGVIFDTPGGAQLLAPAVTVLACGGASWARLGSDGAWAAHVPASALTPFQPANAALSVNWSPHMRPHFGTALKAVRWSAGTLSSRGEAVITERGLEGGGLYTLTPAMRAGGALTVDLAPDVPLARLAAQLSAKPETLRLSRWLKNALRLSPAKCALFLEYAQGRALPRRDWAQTLKALPIQHTAIRPLDEAISTAGGLRFDALDARLMLRARPGTFAAGEMLDWEAPTGGYLLTACLATGRWAGRAAADYP